MKKFFLFITVCFFISSCTTINSEKTKENKANTKESDTEKKQTDINLDSNASSKNLEINIDKESLTITPNIYKNEKKNNNQNKNIKLSSSCKINKNVATDPLNLTDVIELSLCNNPSTRQAWLMSKAAQNARGANFSRYLPHVNLEAEISHSVINDYTHSKKGIQVKNTGADLGISAGWLLYDFGGREAIISKTYATMSSAEFQYNAVLQSVAYETVVSYYTLLAAREENIALILQKETNKKAYDVAKKKFELGMSSKADTLQIETALAASELDVVKSERNLEINNSKLAKLLGLSPSIKLNLASASSKPKTNIFDSKLEELIKIALKKRPDLQAKISDVKASYASVRSASAKFFPTISAYASKVWNDTSSPKFNSLGNDRDTFGIGVKLSLPLFSGFENTYSLAATKYQYVADKQALETYKHDVELSVVDAFYSYKTSSNSINIATKLFESAQENEKVAMGSYKAGKGDIISLMQAQAKLLSARKELISARYGLYISKVALLRAIGKLYIQNLGDLQ